MEKQSTSSASYWNEFVPKSWIFFHRYSWALLRKDLISGMTVGVVALPLAMAFAIAAGVSPERGLYTAIIAGILISLLGGSRFQIGGPTGAFVVVIYEIVQRSGYEGLVAVTILAGIILLIAAFTRLGAMIKYIPYPLVTGFTTGIALVIFSSQIKDFFGLTMGKSPVDFIPKWIAIVHAFPTLHIPTFALALSTLILILLIRRFIPVLPWGITAVVIATLFSWGLELPVETIATRFGAIQRALPSFSFPTHLFSLSTCHLLIPDAITVAFLAGVEALLSAVIADGLAGTRHKSNCELMAQGVANIASVLFGGIPATGAIARTATNIKSGGKTPFAGIIHAITLIFIIMAFAPLVSHIPLSGLSAVLMMIAWNMSEVSHFRRLFKAPPGDIVVLLATFLITVLVDLTVAVEVGMVLALFLFMKRMGKISGVISLTSLEKKHAEEAEKYEFDTLEKKDIPSGVEIFEITGPFFFGVADSLKDVLVNLTFPPKIFILRMRKVPVIDASGMHALKEFYYKCEREGIRLVLAGVSSHVFQSLKKFGVVDLVGEKHIFSYMQGALNFAKKMLEK